MHVMTDGVMIWTNGHVRLVNPAAAPAERPGASVAPFVCGRATPRGGSVEVVANQGGAVGNCRDGERPVHQRDRNALLKRSAAIWCCCRT